LQQGNEATLLKTVRAQFKANMQEVDDDKVRLRPAVTGYHAISAFQRLTCMTVTDACADQGAKGGVSAVAEQLGTLPPSARYHA
jgi:hypothetical protein